SRTGPLFAVCIRLSRVPSPMCWNQVLATVCMSRSELSKKNTTLYPIPEHPETQYLRRGEWVGGYREFRGTHPGAKVEIVSACLQCLTPNLNLVLNPIFPPPRGTIRFSSSLKFTSNC